MNLLLGDSLQILKTLDANSVDSVVTDGPYELGFMNRGWDKTGIVNRPDFWREVLRVMKPGAHLLSFGGTRTYHRMTCAVEDAGFEVRDCLMWLQGQGFPKSKNIGNGLGTALKPSFEPVILAMKPLTGADLLSNLIHECQSMLLAKIARKYLALNQNGLGADASIVQWIAEKNTHIPDVLLEAMDTLLLESARISSLSIELSWLNILAETLKHANTYTTETALSLTIDLKTLSYFLSKHTQESITLGETGQNGELPSALHVANLFHALSFKLNCILTPSVLANASVLDAAKDFRPDAEPIALARKPLEKGLTVAQNVEKWGCGAINVDASRIETNETLSIGSGKSLTFKQASLGTNPGSQHAQGRWPSNILLDEESARLLDFQSGIQASRFFYCAKSAKSERNAGLEGMPDVKGGIKNSSGRGFSESDPHKEIITKNGHPCVKPIKLMEYLIKLITPPNGVVLDPFLGSGSTLVAAKRLGFKGIGIEMSEEYLEIAKKRIENVKI